MLSSAAHKFLLCGIISPKFALNLKSSQDSSMNTPKSQSRLREHLHIIPSPSWHK
jgi:hypothetical protein